MKSLPGIYYFILLILILKDSAVTQHRGIRMLKFNVFQNISQLS